MRLQGFSPLAAELFGFHEADTGRPFSAFTFPLKSTNIHKKAQESLASGVPFQTETADSEGRLYLTCMQPSLSPKRIAILFLRIQDKSFASAVAQKGVAELTSFKFLFESFLDTAPPIAWIQNADGSFRYVNQSFMAHFHLGSSDVQSENPMLFAAPGQEDCEGLNPKEPNRAMSGRIVTWVRPYGQEERLELSLFEVSDVHGAPCYCGIAQNVTERDTAVTTLKQTVAALDAANQRMQEMARIVSHDLRAPAKSMTDLLTNLKGMLATSLSPQAEHIINTLSAMAQGSYETLTDLHEVLYSGKMSEDRPKCLSVMDEVCAALDSLNLRSAEAQVELELQIPDKATLIFPPTAFRSVLYNLLSNAQKYRKAEGPLKITVSYEEIDSRAVLSVEDNGIGIDMEKHRDQIFRLYTRFHHAAPGKGIGLYATKDLLEQFGGALRLESALNKGSTFTVELPINKALLPLK